MFIAIAVRRWKRGSNLGSSAVILTGRCAEQTSVPRLKPFHL